VLAPKRIRIGGVATLTDRFGFGGQRGEAGLAVGGESVYSGAGDFGQRGRLIALGGNLFAQFGHDLKEDIANEVFHLSAGERVGERERRLAGATGAATAPATVEEPSGRAPVLVAGARHLGGGGGMALQASLADAIGQLRIALYGQLDGARADAQETRCGAFGEALAQELAKLKASAVVENRLRRALCVGWCFGSRRVERLGGVGLDWRRLRKRWGVVFAGRTQFGWREA
jgi:hypothetical protein